MVGHEALGLSYCAKFCAHLCSPDISRSARVWVFNPIIHLNCPLIVFSNTDDFFFNQGAERALFHVIPNALNQGRDPGNVLRMSLFA